MTTEKHYYLKHVIEPLLDSLYPYITRIYFNYGQLSRLIEIVKSKYRGKEIINYFAIKREEAKEKKFVIQRITLSGDGAEKDLIAEATRRRIWMEKLGFQVKDEIGFTLLDCLVTSKGLARLIFGSFTDFYENVIRSFIQICNNIDVGFKKIKREIKGEDVELHPFKITYPIPFDQEHFKKLTSQLTNNYMLSVIHGGNPYYVADLLDHEEGSSFGLTVLGREITISPMYRTTNASLWKLTEIIQTVLGEGSVPIEVK